MTWQDILQLVNLALLPIGVALWRMAGRLQRIESIAEAVASLERRLAQVEAAMLNRRS